MSAVQRFCLYCDRAGGEVKGCWRERDRIGGWDWAWLLSSVCVKRIAMEVRICRLVSYGTVN